MTPTLAEVAAAELARIHAGPGTGPGDPWAVAALVDAVVPIPTRVTCPGCGRLEVQVRNDGALAMHRLGQKPGPWCYRSGTAYDDVED